MENSLLSLVNRNKDKEGEERKRERVDHRVMVCQAVSAQQVSCCNLVWFGVCSLVGCVEC